MKKHWFTMGMLLVVALTLFSGVIQGRMRNRWGVSAEMAAAAARLQGIPEQVGNWRLKGSHQMSEDTVNMLECVGYIDRTYVHQQSGAAVTVFIVLGPAGPIAVHTPEVCMGGQYKQLADRKQVSLGEPAESTGSGEVTGQAEATGDADTFWAANFQSKDLRESRVRVYYAWSTGGPWSAPKDARYKFAGQPYLYKIQLQTTLPPGTDQAKSDPCREFLRNFLPAAKEFLIESSVE